MKKGEFLQKIIDYIKQNDKNVVVEKFFYQIGGKNWKIPTRTIDNNMLVFCIGGTGEYVVENKSIEIKKGRVIFISHSVVHSAKQYENDPVHVFAIRFSFKNDEETPKGSFSFDSNNFLTLNNLFSKIGKHLFCKDNDNKSIANRLLSAFFLLLESELISYQNKSYDSYLENLNFTIEKSISINKQVNLTNLYLHYGSKYKFLKAFKEYYNTTYKSYYFHKKMDYARMMIEETNFTFSKIAEFIGYSDQYIFSNQFKKIYNLSPKEYRSKFN